MQSSRSAGRRGFALESAAAKCREAGGRVATNLFVRDLDVNVPNLMDNRRPEVVADGLPVYLQEHSWPWIPLVCPLHADGMMVQFWFEARRRKERTDPELLLAGSRARLVVLAAETGGHWSSGALAFARIEPQLMRKRVEQAWRFRWLSGVAGGSGGSDGPIPSSHKVEGDHCRLGV